MRACRHGAPPLPGARGLEAHGARVGGGGGGGGGGGLVAGAAAAAGEGEAWEEADVGGREPRAERRRRRGRRVERRDAVAAAAVVAEGARGEDEDEEEQGGRGGEEDEDRERGRHHGRLHGERQEARASALAVVAGDGGGAPAVLGFSSRSRGVLIGHGDAGWSGRGHLNWDEVAGVALGVARALGGARWNRMEYSAGIGGETGIGRAPQS